MKYFCIENQENDKHSILGLAISFQIFMQDATLCIMCSDKTYEYIKNFYDFTFNIERISISEKGLHPTKLIENIIKCVEKIHSSDNDAFYLSNSVIIINSLTELENNNYKSPIVSLVRDVFTSTKNVKYPMPFLYFNKENTSIITEKLKKYCKDNEDSLKICYDEHMKLEEIDISEMNDEELHDLGSKKSVALAPCSGIIQSMISSLVEEDDSIITEFFEPERYIDITQFFAGSTSWKLNDFKVSDDLKIVRNSKKCLFTSLCIDHKSLPAPLQSPALQCWNSVEAIACFNDPRIHIVQNITNKLFANRFLITGPKKDLLGNWDRSDMPSFAKTMYQLILTNNYLNFNQYITPDYFRTGFSLLYDYKDSSLFKGDMFHGRKTVAMLLNYDNAVLETLKDKCIYCGLYTPYSLLLEKCEIVEERNKLTYHFTDNSVYDTEESYLEYLDELKHYDKSFITNSTPKSHVVDCLGLGVIPIIDENCRLLEIEDIKGDRADYIEYFKNNLTIKALGKRIIKVHMEYVQAPHEPKKDD